MSLPLLLVGFVISLLFVLTTIIKFKFHPFLSLLLGGILMGIIGGVPLPKIASTMSSGFGSTMGGIGIIIAWGIVLGILLHKSGCTSQIASMMLRAAGEKRAPLAINLTGYLVSIPVFFDAAFVILISLVKQISRKGKIPFISLVTALAVGLITTHAMVIPTPG
ncbi:MAG TPA: gluconate permease, partial [Firmicutes bacterium]|nr:gluconate permease [Bacillota bacterium]